jgi:hypothetical protein
MWRSRTWAAVRIPTRKGAAVVLFTAATTSRIAVHLSIRRIPARRMVCRALMQLVHMINPLVQPEMTACTEILQSRSAMAVVVGNASTSVTTSDVYRLATDPVLGLAAIEWLRRYGPADAGLTTEVLNTLADPSVSGFDRLDAALRLVPVIAGSLSRAQTWDVWRFCVVRASQPTDPYNPVPLSEQSRQAAVELLVRRNELDSEIISSLPAYIRPSLPVPAQLLAAALRRRPNDSGRVLADVVLDWSVSGVATLAFAEAADGAIAQIANPEAGPSWAVALGWRAYRWIRKAVAVLVGPFVALAAVSYVHMHHWRSASVSPGLAEAIAALAVVATVNIFTVQLSAQRLPGPVARVAGRPGFLVASYSVAVTMSVLAAFPDEKYLRTSASEWARIFLFVTFLAALVGAMFVIVRRTDAGRAAHAFAGESSAAHMAAGRRLGRIQASAAAVHALLGDLIGFEMGIAPELVGVRTRVFAGRRGLLLPLPRRLRNISATSSVAGGSVRIRISPGIGIAVSRGDELAAILPASSATIPNGLPRRVRRALRVCRMRRLDDVATSAVALVAMALDLARAGDVGSAGSVGEVVAELVSEHVAAARTARRRRLEREARRTSRTEKRHADRLLRPGVETAAADARARDTGQAPVIPALRDTVKATVRARVAEERDLAGVPEMILRALLRRSELAEATAALIVIAVPGEWEQVRSRPSALMELLKMSGVRALELQDSATIALIRDRLEQLSDRHLEWVVGAASELTALSCWLSPDTAGSLFTWFEELAARVESDPRLDLCRVGAAALVAGVPSVAVRAAASVLRSTPDLPTLRHVVLSDRIRGREDTLSKIGGGYLGTSPGDALADFLTFAERLQPALSRLP